MSPRVLFVLSASSHGLPLVDGGEVSIKYQKSFQIGCKNIRKYYGRKRTNWKYPSRTVFRPKYVAADTFFGFNNHPIKYVFDNTFCRLKYCSEKIFSDIFYADRSFYTVCSDSDSSLHPCTQKYQLFVFQCWRFTHIQFEDPKRNGNSLILHVRYAQRIAF